ncbi:protein KRI1 homolog [Arabidopsis lyrata subsp. lyrata]|uniref:protein KRI1 homolog n=1 Tax=Arabidopsis lyrata subsp. lyrata TaxID=81972 RepID=UPI000A29B701|nr:protein KRI1 homolog [Arabidopsis lyrata subsp. lyrata]|eukprot:XP_020871381.1 protein KRI1 homolog [Arabidopsis lyrata subsp. lyrata]
MKEKMKKVLYVAGFKDGEECPLDAKDFDDEFDPEEYDKMMKAAFDDKYYGAEDSDLNSDEDDDGEKPDFDKEDELLGLPKDWDVTKGGDVFTAAREKGLKHKGNAHHSSRANGELNDMMEHYEGLILGREKEIDAWKKKLSALEAELSSSTGSKHDLEDKVDNLTSELAKIKGELQDQYDQNFKLQEEFSGVQGRLQESESNADSLNNQLIELNAKSASKARKEVKGRGMELIQGAIRFMQTEKARSDLESDIKEHESNLILLDQIHETDFSEEQERTELSTNLSEKRSRLAALPTSTFNPHDFEEFFTESPPISESGLD